MSRAWEFYLIQKEWLKKLKYVHEFFLHILNT